MTVALSCFLIIISVSIDIFAVQEPAIHQAIDNRDRVKLEELLTESANIDVRDSRRDTPLLHVLRQSGQDGQSSAWDRLEVVKLLLDHKADPDAVTTYPYKTPLLLAAEQGNSAIIDALVQHGANPNKLLPGSNTPLHVMVEAADNENGVVLLLEKGADINAKGGNNRTPLHMAVYGHPGMLKLLVSKGADLNAKDGDGNTPLHTVTNLHPQDDWKKDFRADMIQILVDAGADVEAKNKAGKTPLFTAAENNDARDLTNILLKAGAGFENSDDLGLQVRVMPDAFSDEQVKKWFDAHVPDVNIKDKQGETLLHNAVMGKRMKAAAELLSRKADINAKDSHGWTPLHLAAMESQPEMIRFLLNYAPDVNAQDNEGLTPLHYLAGVLTLGEQKTPHAIPAESLRLLLSHGARVDIKDNGGQTPLDRQRSWMPENENGRKYQSDMLQALKQQQAGNASAISQAKKTLYDEDVYIRRKAALDLYYLDDYSGAALMVESLVSSKDPLTRSVANAVLKEMSCVDYTGGKRLKHLPPEQQQDVIQKWKQWWQQNRAGKKADSVNLKQLAKILESDSAFRKSRMDKLIEAEKSKPEYAELKNNETTAPTVLKQFTAAMQAGNETKAFSLMVPHTAADYKQIFADLSTIDRKAFIDDLDSAVLIMSMDLDNMVTYEMLIETDEAITAFPISFVKDGSGNWLIEKF